MKILIATGIFPPDVGGPATYAENILKEWSKIGHQVSVATYRYEKKFPTGLRHFLYFFKVFVKAINADMICVLDTWSAAIPAMYAARILKKKYIIRTGGDFLWESYVERSGDLVPLKDFYTTKNKWTKKENIIFSLTHKVLHSSAAIIFSTNWQRDIFVSAYNLPEEKNFIIENAYMFPETPQNPRNRTFIVSSRNIQLKNLPRIRESFNKASTEIALKGYEPISLDEKVYPHAKLLDQIKYSYAVIVGSISDISSNLALEAIRFGVPVILTKENGLNDRIAGVVQLVDPFSTEDFKEKIVWLSDPKNRISGVSRLSSFSFTHSWEKVAHEILVVWDHVR